MHANTNWGRKMATIKSKQEKRVIALSKASTAVVVQEFLAKTNLSEEEIQNIINRGESLCDLVAHAITTALQRLSLNDEFVKEEIYIPQIDCNYYQSGYSVAKSIESQIKILRQTFSLTGHFNSEMLATIDKDKLDCNTDSDGWFAIPHWSQIGMTYHEAVMKVFEVLSNLKERKGAYIAYESSLLVKETEEKTAVMEKLFHQQETKNVIIQAQLGKQHRGRSARRMNAVMSPIEFPLGIYEIGIILLTHTDRLMLVDDDIHILCSGSINHGDSAQVMNVGCYEGQFRLQSQNNSFFEKNTGVASGFLM